MPTESNEQLPASFPAAWQFAAEHFQSRFVRGTYCWVRNHRFTPIIEHLSFRLGNQLFFVFIELPGELPFVDDVAELFLQTAADAQAIPCLLPLLRHGDSWAPRETGWGLVDARTGDAIDPPSTEIDAPIETSEYECQALAVGLVVSQLQDEGKEIISFHPYANREPSILFRDEEGPAWIVVQFGIYPVYPHEAPRNLLFLARSLAMQEWPRGYYAPVGLCSREQDVGAEKVHPLWRVPGLKGSVGNFQEIPQSTPAHLVRERDSVLFDEIMRLFYDFDPAGIRFGNNTDEYAAETGTIIERLPEADSLDDFIVILTEELNFWFSPDGIDRAKPLAILAEQIWATWQAHHSAAPADGSV